MNWNAVRDLEAAMKLGFVNTTQLFAEKQRHCTAN
jgi:hypothetical protein